ncbi:MAG: pantoate--beta-alanine ligase, partial [Planctomycetota bacterium]
QGFSTFVNPPDVALTLEGNHRPGHFQGVCTVVLKLFHAVPATHAYFGMKDYQQFKVISAMVADLDLGLSVVGCDIFREPDGLAMSSRNRYLSSAERAQALVIQRSLSKALASWREGQSVRQIEEQLHADLLSGTDGAPGLDRIDYAKIVDADTLEPTRSMIPVAGIALVAGFVGKTRLIDNQLLPRRERPADR